MSFTAGKIRVLIATTNGPVEVQLLTEEDAAIGRCVACIGGTTETADIASAYHAFVVRPTGIIEGRFGHSCYRLDVSGRIDAGSSWQLGVLAAHALLAAGRLAQENDKADAILWATGSVRPVDLTVGGVSHVAEKLANSLARLTQERAARRRVLLAVPAANAADALPTATLELRKLGAEFVTVAHAQALFDKLGMKLPGIPAKGSAPAAPSDPASEPLTPAKSRLGMIAWTAGAVMTAIFAAGIAGVLPGISTGPTPRASRPEPAKQASAPAPSPVVTPAPEPASRPDPRPPEPKGPEFDPDKIPFITANERERIRNEYFTASEYKALAMTMFSSHFVSGLPSQEAADKAAMEACETNKPHHPTNANATVQVEYRCQLYASGIVVVSPYTNIPMPPTPWIDSSVQRPFVASQIPLASPESQRTAQRVYVSAPRSKAAAVGPNGHHFATSGDAGAEQVMRRTLERCGAINKVPCIVLVLDDTFVNAIPTLAKAVGFYRPDSLYELPSEERAAITRQLAASSRGWNAVAFGAAHQVGVRVGADSERSAVDGALGDCAQHDHDCRIAVIGPWLVEAPPAPAQSPASAEKTAPPPATANATPPSPQAPSPAQAPSPPSVAHSPPAPPPYVPPSAPVASPAPKAAPAPPAARTTPAAPGGPRVPQTELER
jgi:hypothetical protein